MIRYIASAAGLTLTVLSFVGPAPKVQPVKTAPLAYFDAHCSRCHGYMGSFYGKSFGRNLTDSQLQEKVRQMAAGPGEAPLAGTDLAAQVAFHRSLVDPSPFIVWTKSQGAVFAGEVTPDAKVTATVNGKAVSISVRDSSWTLKASGPAVVTAKMGGKTTKLDLSKAAFSHAMPNRR